MKKTNTKPLATGQSKGACGQDVSTKTGHRTLTTCQGEVNPTAASEVKKGNRTLNTCQGEVNPVAKSAMKTGNRTLNTCQGEVNPTAKVKGQPQGLVRTDGSGGSLMDVGHQAVTRMGRTVETGPQQEQLRAPAGGPRS